MKNLKRKTLVSTVILLCLAIGVIFWRPPFRLPHVTKRVIIPIIFIMMLTSLLLLGAFKSSPNETSRSQSASQADSAVQARQQTQFAR